MRLMERDRKVLKHVEKYKSITLAQAVRIFFSKQNSGYNIAERRLNKLVKENYLKVGTNNASGENVYYMTKQLSHHDLIVLNFMAELMAAKVQDLEFETKKYWLDNTLISDGFAKYIVGDYTYWNFVEVALTHSPDIKRYEELYKSGEAHQLHGNGKKYFPSLIIIDDVDHKKPPSSEYFPIITVDFGFKNFPKIFVND